MKKLRKGKKKHGRIQPSPKVTDLWYWLKLVLDKFDLHRTLRMYIYLVFCYYNNDHLGLFAGFTSICISCWDFFGQCLLFETKSESFSSIFTCPMRWCWQSHFFLSDPWSFFFWLQKSWLCLSPCCLMSVLEESLLPLCPPFIIPTIWQTSLSTCDVPGPVLSFRESKWKTWCCPWADSLVGRQRTVS